MSPVRSGCLVLALLGAASRAFALPAFPGAEGFGATTPGGRGGAVVEVTSLADEGPGTLRAALEDASGPRTVVFRVSGTITSSRHILLRGEAGSWVTVAGQTAPGDGIQIANYGIQLSDGAHDVVLRYLRIRPSSGAGDFTHDIDAIELWGNDGTQVHHVVVDHCSLEWAMDENLSAWANVTDVTVQRTIIAEAVLDGQSHDQAKGVLIAAAAGDPKPDRFSFHHVLFAHNPDRNPRVAYVTMDFRNNVVFDYQGNNATQLGPFASFPPGPHTTDVNLVNNVWKKGLGTYAGYDDVGWLNANTRVFVAGNVGPKCPTGCADAWDVGFREEFGAYGPAAAATYRVAAPFATPWVTTYDTAALAGILLANVGASLPVRDAVDARILADVLAGTGTPGQGSGYPSLASAPPPADADHDGMPDDWETLHGLSSADPDDRNGDQDGDGYTNLEEYLSSIVSAEFGCGDGVANPGEPCDDGNAVDGDGCDTNCTPTACGNGIRSGLEACDDGNVAPGDCCDATCQLEPPASPCDDADLCTTGEACDATGACGGGGPATTCTSAAKGAIQIDGHAEKLGWKWSRGAATSGAELGDPVAGGTSYAMCVYAGASPALVFRADLPASAARWKAGGGGYKYRSTSGAPGGVVGAVLKPGAAGKASLQVKGRSSDSGSALAVPTLPLATDGDVTVQLHATTGACWSQTYPVPARRNDAKQYKDAVP